MTPSIFKVVLGMGKHLTVQGKRVTASHVICAQATAAQSFVGWKQAIEFDTSTLKSVITFHRNTSEGETL